MEYPEGIQGNTELELAFMAANTPPANPPAPPVNPPAPPDNPPAPPIPPVDPPPPGLSLSVFGDYKTPEELKAELDTLKSFKENYGTGYEGVDPDLLRLAYLKKTSPEEFNLFASMKISGNVDKLELLVDDYVKTNPGYNEKRDIVRSFLKSEFGLDIHVPLPAPEDASDEERAQREIEINNAKQRLEFATMKLNQKALEVESKLNERFNSIPLPSKKADVPITQEVRDQIIGKWGEAGQAISQKMTSLPVESVGPDNKPVKVFDFNLEATHKAEIAKLFQDIGAKSNIPNPTEEQVQMILATAMNIFELNHKAEINKALFHKVRGLSELEFAKIYENPSPVVAAGGDGLAGLSKYEQSRKAAFESENSSY